MLADLSERGRIVSASYWQKFRVFMDEVAAANFMERTDMLVICYIMTFEVVSPCLIIGALGRVDSECHFAPTIFRGGVSKCPSFYCDISLQSFLVAFLR